MAITGQRRSGDRILGTWDGRCRARAAAPWAYCVIVDLSLGGTGVLVPPATPIEGWLEVDVRAVLSRRRSVVLGGAVRNVSTLPDGWRRIALQFTELRRSQRRKLDRLLERGR